MTIQASVPDSPSAPLLEVTLGQLGGVCVMALHGELRLASLPVLEAEFDRLGCMSCQEVVLDVTGLDAIDDAGSRVLTGLHHYVEARGGCLTVAGANARIMKALAESPVRRR